jgi:hypothetical protein
MGGGDLNLKKSWHPGTFKNRETIWKAQQAAAEEARKVEQLKREMIEEQKVIDMRKLQEDAGLIKKTGDRIEWMYSGVNAQKAALDEEYLLGKRRIDDALNEKPTMNDLGKSKGAQLFGFVGSNTDKDLAAKLREDPLFAIKRKEQEALNAIMSNPWKRKQLEIAQGKHESQEKKVEKEREEKRLKERVKEVERDEERIKERDNKNNQDKRHRETEKRYDYDERGKSRYNERERDERERDERERYERERYERERRYDNRKSGNDRYERSDRHRERREYRDRSSERYRERSKPKMSEEERRRKLEEMKKDAEWNDSTRSERIKKYSQEDREDEERGKDIRGKFIQDVQKQAFSTDTTLEERLKSRRFNRERSENE